VTRLASINPSPDEIAAIVAAFEQTLCENGEALPERSRWRTSLSHEDDEWEALRNGRRRRA